jgi:c-di-GMP-binding flagellar brake protein YcgR
VSEFSQDHPDRRAHPRTKVSVQTELHLTDKDTPMREQTSDLSLGGCYIETMITIPVGTRLDVALWLGEEKVTINAIVVTCYPQVGNGIQFLAMPPAVRNQVRSFLESLRDSS